MFRLEGVTGKPVALSSSVWSDSNFAPAGTQRLRYGRYSRGDSRRVLPPAGECGRVHRSESEASPRFVQWKQEAKGARPGQGALRGFEGGSVVIQIESVHIDEFRG